MENLKKTRSVLRSFFSRVLNKLNALLENEPIDQLEVQANFRIIELKVEEIQDLDKQIFDMLLSIENTIEDELLAETSKAAEYLCLFEKVKFRVQKIIQSNDVVSVQSEAGTSIGLNKRKFKLPQIELKRFDGDLINWLPFWSQFCKIHNDCEIDPEDKFQYLLQAVVPGSRAFDVVQSFPPTRANYSKVIESLQTRFGKEDLLVEVYVRELLKIVLQNALGGKNTMTLQCLYDKLESHLRALETLGVTTDKCSSMLYPLVESCMPEDLLRAWQRSSFRVGNDPQERLDNLMKFMLSEVEGEQRIGLAMSGFGINCPGKEKQFRKLDPIHSTKKDVSSASSLVSFSKNQNVCIVCTFCKKNHRSCDCFAAQKMSLPDKQSILKEKKCCFCCLQPGHTIRRCRANLTCPLCKRRHYIIMCPNIHSKDTKAESVNNSLEDTSKEMTILEDNVLASKSSNDNPKVFMQTLVAKIRNPKSNRVEIVRILIDSGSQRSYILSDLAVKMGYESLGEETIIHSLFGNIKSAKKGHNRYRVFLTSQNSDYKCNFEVLSQPVICGKISPVTEGPWLHELAEKNVSLSDAHDTCLPISILVGADVAGKLFTGNRIQLKSGLVAMETLLGWTLMGKVPGEQNSRSLSTVVTSMFINDADISELWRLDSLGITDPSEQLSKEQKIVAVKQHFSETTIVNEEGRYEVSLPWVDGHPPLPENRDLAEKRLFSIGKKLENNSLLADYDSVFKQWLSDGIIEVVPSDELDRNCHYLSHRPVVKESSTTTRIRPVFDASARSKLSPSLNDCLESGPNLIELIPSVMLRFREGRYGVIADIAKAFLQISVNKEDRDFLRFLWFKDIDRDQLMVYRHKRVVFGVKCSPFLLGAVIDLHLQRSIASQNYNPRVIDKLQKSFYVDNVSTSVDTLEELEDFVTESREIMAAVNFDVRGWQATSYSEEGHTNCITNVLGIQWDYDNDLLFVNLSCLKDFDVSHITKREILSISHRIFDPIGVICPVMLFPKLLLQNMWNTKIDWDTEVSMDVRQKFIAWYNELSVLQEVRIPRWLGKTTNDSTGCSIHTFCDASKDAYAVAVYLRVENEDGISVQLVSAKSRVAPLKKTSIPRLELLATTVGARLTKTIVEAMDWNNIPVYYWTDSSTVLAWIKQDSNWNVFVWNRVSEIRKLTDVNQWNHVPGEKNPADLPSRGCGARYLSDSRWWEGPEWLRMPKNQWPMNEDLQYNTEEINVEKRKKSQVSTGMSLINKEIIFDWCRMPSKLDSDSKCCSNSGTKWYSRYYSTYPKMIRLTAWILRFFNNFKLKKSLRLSGELSARELEEAEVKLLKTVQSEMFTGVNDKILSALDPITDTDGLIRLKTKVSDKEDGFGFKFPIVLAPKHPVVEALVLDYHKRNCHAGVQIIMNTVRERFWILGGRRSIRSVVSKCVICKRHSSKNFDTIPAVLPPDRVRESAVFEVTGVDFAGPLYLKNYEKAWICLFTCANYRAVHLELVTSLSTHAFIQAFRRFVARRGRPSIIYSDNGTNFAGASNLLRQINWKEIEKYSFAQRIIWKFNPPTAAWWGGWWERLIRLLKDLLKRVLGKACLNFQEMTTVLCDCEAVINSRPLTYVYDGMSELSPLTPNHFLQEIRENGVPDFDKIDQTSLNKRFKYIQSLRQNLRQRFRKEYLGQLVHKSSKLCQRRSPSVGDVVLIECENVKRLNWPLGLVIETIPDKSGVVRLVKLRTAHGTLLRPIQRLYPLEVTSENFEIKKKDANNVPRQNIIQEELKTRCGRQIKVPKKFTLLC